MKLYIAGPMTGLPQFNIPAFDAAAAALRLAGHYVVSPAELDSPEMRAFALQSPDGKMPADGKIASETWGDVLARDVRIISDQVHAIAFLPGWEKSRGARLEAFVGLLTGKLFAYYVDGADGNLLRQVDRSVVQQVIRENMP
jgi:Domain of unknown function (DUF4406)